MHFTKLLYNFSIMATKKGLCPYCDKERKYHHVFPVNPEAKTCFCPLCMKEMVPTLAIDNYSKLITYLLDKADNTLFVACDPQTAYQQYADVLEFEKNDAHALIGRVLCLVYMGKVRKSYLKEAYILLENTSYVGKDLDIYVNFLKKINFALDEYDDTVNRKLTIKDFYYDVECLKLYWVHLNEVIHMKELLLSIFLELKKKYTTQQNGLEINLLERSIEGKTKKLKTIAFTTDGKGYKFDRIVNNKAIVSISDKKTSNIFTRFRLSTLNENDHGKRYIKDEVFKDYTAIIHSRAATRCLWIILYLLTIGAGVAAYFIRTKAIFISLVAAGAATFVLGTIVLILTLHWNHVLRKRKLRIN